MEWWVDGVVGGWIGGWMDWWVDGVVCGWGCGWMEWWVDRVVGGWSGGWIDVDRTFVLSKTTYMLCRVHLLGHG